MGLKVLNSTKKGLRCHKDLFTFRASDITEIAGLDNVETTYVIKYLDEDKRFKHVKDPA